MRRHVEGCACLDTENRYGGGQKEAETDNKGCCLEMWWSAPERGVVQSANGLLVKHRSDRISSMSSLTLQAYKLGEILKYMASGLN